MIHTHRNPNGTFTITWQMTAIEDVHQFLRSIADALGVPHTITEARFNWNKYKQVYDIEVRAALMESTAGANQALIERAWLDRDTRKKSCCFKSQGKA